MNCQRTVHQYLDDPLEGEDAPGATFQAMYPTFANLQHSAHLRSAERTHLLARHDVSSPNPVVHYGPAWCMRVLPRKKPVWEGDGMKQEVVERPVPARQWQR